MAEVSTGIPVGEGGELDTLHQAQVAVLDFGSQFTGQVDRTVRESGYRCDILPGETPAEELQARGYSAVIYSGGPDSVFEEDSRKSDPAIHDLGIPQLGICYGMQIIAQHFGGVVGDSGLREDGKANTALFGSPLFGGLETNQDVWMSHGDSVLEAPEGFTVIGGHETEDGTSCISAIANEDRRIYGVQFHPEVHGTKQGKQIVGNFLSSIAGLEQDYTIEDQITEAKAEIREKVGNRDVAMYLSGGVDSSVMAALISDTVPVERIHAFIVDHGFMRAGEVEEVVLALAKIGMQVNIIDAQDRFRTATTTIDGSETLPLYMATEPQLKREIIGNTFDSLVEEIKDQYGLPKDAILAQGTIRPDLIESGSAIVGTGQKTIKTHHNDTEQARDRRERGDTVEPLKWLYKDQVREVGRRLGLPDHIVDRQPFPGPGGAIRIICAKEPTITPDRQVAIQADLDSLLDTGSRYVPQGFARAEVLPIQTVGVQGENRTYDALVAVHGSVHDWGEYSHLARDITNKKFGVNRVVYAFNDTGISDVITPTTLYRCDEEAEELGLNLEVLDQWKHADAIVRYEFSNAGLDRIISQLPVISAPVSYGAEGQRAIALRPFISPDFTTGRAAIPGEDFQVEVLHRTVNRLLSEVPGISQVFYDLTDKPPGTTEWE